MQTFFDNILYTYNNHFSVLVILLLITLYPILGALFHFYLFKKRNNQNSFNLIIFWLFNSIISLVIFYQVTEHIHDKNSDKSIKIEVIKEAS